MSDPLVTVVVVPRERFAKTRESIESIFQHTKPPFKTIVVDGGSPAPVRNWLRQASSALGFNLIRVDHFLSPNRARNLGLRQVDTKYVVFNDNDVIVTPGWLDKLVECAEQTGADCVSPLICQGVPVHNEIHCSTGVVTVRQVEKDGKTERHIYDRIDQQGMTVEQARPTLTRQPTTLLEFHCVLLRTEAMRKIGQFDEKMLNTREHIDLSLSLQQAGCSIWFEPDSIVTYLLVPPLDSADIPFYRLRWSEEWQRASLMRFKEKWDLVEDGYFKARLGRLGWRREQSITKPFFERHPLLRKVPKCRGLYDRYQRLMGQRAAQRYDRQVGL